MSEKIFGFLFIKTGFVIITYECVASHRVMAQVSCELVAPKENRPNEGIMFFNIELSPMASPAFEQGRWEIFLLTPFLFLKHFYGS